MIERPGLGAVDAAGARGVDDPDPTVGLADEPLTEPAYSRRGRRRRDDEQEVGGFGGQQSVVAGQHLLDLGQVREHQQDDG